MAALRRPRYRASERAAGRTRASSRRRVQAASSRSTGDAVLLVRQPRFAADAAVVEIVKGGRHAGESALDCAKRELREETGFSELDAGNELGQGFEIPSIVEPGCHALPGPRI